VIKNGVNQNHEYLLAKITFVPSRIFASFKSPEGPEQFQEFQKPVQLAQSCESNQL
jgi:hypothetical protein